MKLAFFVLLSFTCLLALAFEAGAAQQRASDITYCNGGRP